MFSSGDYFAMISMAFALVMVLVIGGFVLLFPVARRLGTALEEWIAQRRELTPVQDGVDELRREIGELGALVSNLRGDLEDVRERQRFLEDLAEDRSTGRIGNPPGSR